MNHSFNCFLQLLLFFCSSPAKERIYSETARSVFRKWLLPHGLFRQRQIPVQAVAVLLLHDFHPRREGVGAILQGVCVHVLRPQAQADGEDGQGPRLRFSHSSSESEACCPGNSTSAFAASFSTLPVWLQPPVVRARLQRVAKLIDLNAARIIIHRI